MFASKTLTEHVARGVVGIAALAASVLLSTSHPWSSVLAVPVALIALRGCPMCWTLGLVQTVMAKLQGRPSAGCVDGSCAVRRG